MSFNKPTSDEWHSVENYVWNKKQLDEKECRFIYHKEDLVTLRPGREHAWLDSSVEKMLRWLNCDLIEVSAQRLSGTLTSHTDHYSGSFAQKWVTNTPSPSSFDSELADHPF